MLVCIGKATIIHPVSHLVLNSPDGWCLLCGDLACLPGRAKVKRSKAKETEDDAEFQEALLEDYNSTSSPFTSQRPSDAATDLTSPQQQQQQQQAAWPQGHSSSSSPAPEGGEIHPSGGTGGGSSSSSRRHKG
jgi:hypothetical protein